MILRRWEDLPEVMKIPEVRPYYEALEKKRFQLLLKRVFDFVCAAILLVILCVPMLVIALLIKIDTKGPVFYRQERVTSFGKQFRIHKFRTMVDNAECLGTAVTVKNDGRVTRIGKKIRRCRLDELPQLLDVIAGNMSFVGTRPEAVRYVEQYKPEYLATLLLPAGITSEASIRYKDEDRLLASTDSVDRIYVEKVLPGKMRWNLEAIKSFCIIKDIQTMIWTVLAVMGKRYDEETVDEQENYCASDEQ